jgi:ABC-type transport system substrate-binding protein
MAEAMNIKTTKAKILMVTIVLAALVAAMAATAKPAEAATYCNSSASAPSYIKPENVGGQTVIQFPSRITCTGGNALSGYLIRNCLKSLIGEPTASPSSVSSPRT